MEALYDEEKISSYSFLHSWIYALDIRLCRTSREFTYNAAGNFQSIELLFVVRARFRAVVGDEDNLLSFCFFVTREMSKEVIERVHYRKLHLPLLLSSSNVSTVPGNVWSPDQSTPVTGEFSKRCRCCGCSWITELTDRRNRRGKPVDACGY